MPYSLERVAECIEVLLECSRGSCLGLLPLTIGVVRARCRNTRPLLPYVDLHIPGVECLPSMTLLHLRIMPGSVE